MLAGNLALAQPNLDNSPMSGTAQRGPIPPPTVPKLAEAPPRELGRYTLLKPLARGGMGEVYLAASGSIEGAERPCVVKIIRREHAEDKSFVARFLDEARVQSQLQHPGVAQVLEASTSETGIPYVVVEYIEGRNLADVRYRSIQMGHPISWADAIAIGASLAEALAHVHERTDASGRALGIVHRDLSPQNVMIGYEGDVKLIDFGTARGENRRCRTVSGVVFAKPGYVAPEVAKNIPGGIPADLYALGIMLWELLSGKRFLEGDPAEHVAALAAGQRAPAALKGAGGLPLDIDPIIARLTAFEIEDRYSSARAAASDLMRLLKRAPSLSNGERGVRPRISLLMQSLHPLEPAKSRAEFGALVSKLQRQRRFDIAQLPQSPTPSEVDNKEGILAGTRYRLLRCIARSDQGEVFEAEHLDLGRSAALKILPKERCSDARITQRFRAEARAVAQLQHPNIVRLHDFGLTHDGRPFFAMEYLEGENLADYIKREHGMDWREAIALIVQISEALAEAHQQGVVHRDIKPSNLFIQASGKPKLIDFGVARQLDEHESSGEALKLHGTPAYMAPEQGDSHASSAASDQYALAVVLYELCSGKLPHQANSEMEWLAAKQGIPPLASSVAPHRGLPTKLDTVLARALSVDPKSRFATISDFAVALKVLLKSPKTRGPWKTFSIAAIIPFLLGGLWLANEKHPELKLASTFAPLDNLIEEPNKAAQAAHPAQGLDWVESYPERGNTAPKDDEVAQADNQPSPTASSEAEESAKEPVPLPEKAYDFGKDQALWKRAQRYARAKNAPASLEACRKLGDNGHIVSELYQLWGAQAEAVRAYGEVHQVAIQWAKNLNSVESRLNLARAQRLVGKKSEAQSTLQALLAEEPENTGALVMMRQLGG